MDSDLVKIPKLKNVENWGIWKFQIRIILNAYGALDIANGTEQKPVALAANAAADAVANHETSMAKWKKSDAMAQKVIATSVGDQP